MNDLPETPETHSRRLPATHGSATFTTNIADARVAEALYRDIAFLRNGIDCAANALTDSILCSGNDAKTNLHFVRKLRALLSSLNAEALAPADNNLNSTPK